MRQHLLFETGNPQSVLKCHVVGSAVFLNFPVLGHRAAGEDRNDKLFRFVIRKLVPSRNSAGFWDQSQQHTGISPPARSKLLIWREDQKIALLYSVGEAVSWNVLTRMTTVTRCDKQLTVACLGNPCVHLPTRKCRRSQM